MKSRYKYPRAAYPFADLVQTSRCQSRHAFDYELLDTEVLDGDRYMDVVVADAKDSREGLLSQATVSNHGPEAASLHRLQKMQV
jgi:hypothetical protein